MTIFDISFHAACSSSFFSLAADGTISPIFVDRMLALGDWLKINGQAIYNSRPWKVCAQDSSSPSVYYTRDEKLLYAHLTRWPSDNEVVLSCPELSNDTKAFLLGTELADESNEITVEPNKQIGRAHV